MKLHQSLAIVFLHLILVSSLAGLAHSDVRIEKDVDYLGKGRSEKADLYLPPADQDANLHPGIVIIHGGGWTAEIKAPRASRTLGLRWPSRLCLHEYQLQTAAQGK